MRRRGLRFWLPCLLLAGGCAPHEAETALVSPSAFNSPPAPAVRTASYAPAPIALAARVDAVGRKLVAANKAFGVDPLFCTIGAPKPEIFHEGMRQVMITSGLVEQCKTDGQLAAVLATELARMVVEREAQAGPAVRRPDPLPSINQPAGSTGAFGPADQVGLAEMARFQPPRRPANAPPPRLPDPQQLARTYLRNAQFAEAELDRAAPVLNAATANGTFERQMAIPQKDRDWTKPE